MKKQTSNFQKRFGNRISITYAEKTMNPSEQKIFSRRLLKAYIELLTSILKRKPTDEELLGLKPIHFPKPDTTKS